MKRVRSRDNSSKLRTVLHLVAEISISVLYCSEEPTILLKNTIVSTVFWNVKILCVIFAFLEWNVTILKHPTKLNRWHLYISTLPDISISDNLVSQKVVIGRILKRINTYVETLPFFFFSVRTLYPKNSPNRSDEWKMKCKFPWRHSSFQVLYEHNTKDIMWYYFTENTNFSAYS